MGDPFFMLQFYFMLRGQVQQRSLENLGLGPILISGGIKNRPYASFTDRISAKILSS